VLAVFFSSARLRNKPLLRALVIMPSIIPAFAVFQIISGLTDPLSGWLPSLVLEPLHLPPSTDLFFLLPLVLALWSIGPSFLILLGAVQSVPLEIYEAARVDGAGPLTRLGYITLPMISPAILFCLVINITNAFGGVVLLDRGAPYSQSLSPMENYINYQMFSLSNLGYASALAWLMLAVVITIVLAVFYSARYWVYFPEEGAHV
jgi:multiple sugar transport system permease protein